MSNTPFKLTMLLALTISVDAASLVYTDIGDWQNAIRHEEVFLTTRGNMALANEIPDSLGDSFVGPVNTLTFEKSSTGLSRDFTVRALNSGTDLRWYTGANYGAFGDAIEIGGTDNDDWEFVISGGPGMRAIAFELRDNENFSGESIRLVNSDGVVVETIDLSLLGLPEYGDPNWSDIQFVGIVSASRFDAIQFDEADEANGDDIALANFRFSSVANVPDIGSTATLCVIGFSLLLGVKRVMSRSSLAL